MDKNKKWIMPNTQQQQINNHQQNQEIIQQHKQIINNIPQQQQTIIPQQNNQQQIIQHQQQQINIQQQPNIPQQQQIIIPQQQPNMHSSYIGSQRFAMAILNDMDSQTLSPKSKYRELKKKFKYLVYENEYYQEELRNLQRKLLKLSRDKNFLLDRLGQHENLSESSDDSDASTKTLDDIGIPKPKRKRPSQARRRPPPVQNANNTTTSNSSTTSNNNSQKRRSAGTAKKKGQDPYHNQSQAHGLCFSVPQGIPPPPSLKNIFKELASEFPNFKIPNHGELTCWARQGIFMLNATLTVELI
ncbi:hypothetical protein Mgra_00003619 [Meloidogyne graminicola]|uniref:INO80 complex subunit E N-terminal domain-containing protein n=1 Tax=Meloidogyne graminicola TaxID=189291 RepID=A0A8S9ZV67_9BILA|nr:hypothetical protein Mgra_00003619 [Meloidogyne graminicola]